jgi:FkbM family methyltransferase
MGNTSKLLLQRVLRRFGWEIRRFTRTELQQLVLLLTQNNIDLVLDVGANEGQYASSLRSAGYSGRIVSFEALKDAHRKLERRAVSDPAWQVAPRAAVGAQAGHIEINVSRNSVSSSALPILPLHLENAQSSRYTGKETVPLIRLDSSDVGTLDSRAFLKIDTQGFEQEVLKGATKLLPRIYGLQIEVSIAPLYLGQPSFTELIDYIHDFNYELWNLYPGFSSPTTGRLLQLDAIFLRKQLS